MTNGGAIAFGPFLLEHRLASGGTAEVWTAHFANAQSDAEGAGAPREGLRPLVVKRLLPSLLRDADARGAFAKEAAIYARCTHPNIVSCFGSGFAGDEPWLAMELVLGADLDAVLRFGRQHGERLSTGVAVSIVRSLLAALAALHDARGEDGTPLEIIHRDVTPSNVYLSTEGDVKLGDLGIARYITSTRTPAGLGVRGKFAYLAPEQVAGEKVDQRTDLFAAANVLCEALLGRRLFDGSGQLAVLLAVRDGRIDALKTHGGHLPPALVSVLERALARDPNDRYPDARALSNALAPFAAADGPSARTSPCDDVRAEIGRVVSRVRGEEVRADVRPPPLVVSPPSMFPGAMMSIPPVAIREAPPPPRAIGALPPRAIGALPPRAIGATSRYQLTPSHVRTTDGRTLGPLYYAQLVEMVASGALSPDDEIDFLGTGFVPLRKIDDLAGHLAPRQSAATAQIAGLGAPDWCGPASEPSDTHLGGDPGAAGALAWIAGRRATGALFATRADERVEIYFHEGHALHVPQPDAELAEPLVAQGQLSQADYERARSYGGRLGEDIGHALIGLGLVAPDVWSRHLAACARRAIVELFDWRSGELSFYREGKPRKVEHRLSLQIGPLIEEGVALVLPDHRAIARRDVWRTNVVALDAPGPLRAAGWSPIVEQVVERARQPVDPNALVDRIDAPPAVVVRAIVCARLSRMIGLV
ncbi:MAG: serine/threonine protein kinase [Deltaproteobacteria bacterium]|nr:serine/threonine protein kinase [Deltaproteobacteria bacterium]